MAKQEVVVIGGTGRTGRRLVSRLCADNHFHVTAIVRDPEKAHSIFSGLDVNVVKGDLHDVSAWADRLVGVSQIITAVSCGQWIDPKVVLGMRSEPDNMPYKTDAQGIASLAAAAKERGVRRIVVVTTASAGSPWSPAAIFLNSVHYGSVKRKWEGEQAVRESGLDYVIIRPYGLGPDAPAELSSTPEGQALCGIEWSQGKTVSSERRRIPRDDVAHLCHEALLLPSEGQRLTFECWANKEHARAMEWSKLTQDPPGALPSINHDLPVATAVGGVGLIGAGLLRGSFRLLRFVIRR